MPLRTLAAASRRAFDERPLVVILIVGAALRLIAAIFSRGFFTIDDHHVLVDTADRVARGVPLPVNYGRSILYPGSVALIMDAVRAVAQASPAVEMAVVRLVHGAFSVLSVYFAYRILEHVAGREAARVGGLLLATFYLLPATSVHQFEEAVCQVPILASCWWLLKADEPARGASLWSFLSGAAIATSLLIRFPALPYVVAFVAVALWRPAARSSKLSFALGVLLVLALQAASNVVINGDPLYYLFRTARHRAGLGGGYPTAPFWKYAVTLVAAFLPPFSLLFLAAAIRGAKRFALLGIPALAFLVGTSLVPNKQERFLLPVLPVLLILGAIGLPAVRDWFARRGWTRAYNWSWGYFAVVNAALLGVGVFSYGKKDRVAPLVYLEHRHDATGIVEAQFTYGFPVPGYYLGRSRPAVFVFEDRGRLAADIATAHLAGQPVNYVVLYSDSLEADTALLERTLGRTLVVRTTISPSLGDDLAHFINPHRNHATRAVVLSVQPLPAASP